MSTDQNLTEQGVPPGFLEALMEAERGLYVNAEPREMAHIPE